MNLRELRERAESRNAEFSSLRFLTLSAENVLALLGLVDSLHAALRETMEMVEYGPLNAADRALALFDSFGSVPPETETP